MTGSTQSKEWPGTRRDDSGEPVLYSAAGRDDRAYEAAVDRLIADISVRGPAPLGNVALHWARKGEAVDGLLTTYDPGKRRKRRRSVGRLMADSLVGRI